MKLFAFSILCAFCGCLERRMIKIGRALLRPVQWLREWSWHGEAREHLRTYGLRKVDFHL